MIAGGVEAGPNAVLAFKRLGYNKWSFSLRDTAQFALYPGFWAMGLKFWKMGLGEFYRSFSKKAFVKALQRLIPEIQGADLQPGGAGVRAQALEANGFLVDDFPHQGGRTHGSCSERAVAGGHGLHQHRPVHRRHCPEKFRFEPLSGSSAVASKE